ncbi:polysaccharide biosynthesis protein [Daejeonella sp.]|jgi:FlaA1/EpsC-like NDP-sugar epimerase|uniref:polysaccharide biosynthesis protein n=1 Tax=Daejeonella sp. TaxID=2805397 RepID=UPI0037BE83EF
MIHSIFKEKTSSRWLIFSIDFIIQSIAFVLSYLIIQKFHIQQLFTGSFLFYFLSFIVLRTLVFLFIKIHTGIIRYSNTEDIIRIFKAVSISSLLFWLVSNTLFIPIFNFNLESLEAVIIVDFFISASLLIFLRITVKSLFSYVKSLDSAIYKAANENILIYGSDKNALLIKKAFELSQEKNYKVIGFVDDDPDRINKNLEQIQVYSSETISFLKKKHVIDKVVIMSNELNIASKNSVIKQCMDLGISVLSVPHSTQWINGTLSLNQIKNLNIEDLLQRAPIILKRDNIFRELSGKRILVTGAAGSIGSELVRQLINYNPELLILCDQAETPLHELQLELEEKYPNAPTKVYMANIQNYKRIKALFSVYQPQVVFHAAAYKHVSMMEDHPFEAILTNVLGTKNLADMSLEFKAEKFIMISTDKAVNPTNIMGASKRLAEMYIQSLNFHQAREMSIQEVSNNKEVPTRFITTRFGNVLGSNGSVVPRFKEQISNGGPVTITHPQITRYFMTIPEAVQLVLEACAMGKGGEIFIFDMGEPVKIVDMAKNMIRLAGLIPDKDINIVFTGLRPGEKLYEELLNKGENIIPTHHSKIKISKVINFHFFYVERMISELIEMMDFDDHIGLARKLNEIIPEFKSNNAVYCKSDEIVVN